MKFKIVYDNDKDTIRVRAGKSAFTNEEGYGLSKLLSNKKGIKTVKVSAVNGSIYIKYTCDKLKVFKYLSSIKKSDLFEAEPTTEELSAETNRKYINKIIKKISTRFFVQWFLPAPLNILKTAYDSIPYVVAGLDSLIHLRLDVDLLDATSLVVTMSQGMFGPASSIAFLLGLSEILEDYTIEKTKHSLENSLMLNINQVWIETETGEEVQIPFTDLKEGDKVVVRTGTIIPVDGIIVSGEAEINEATMTGESLAVEKTEGSAVFAGTIVENGSITVEVEALNESTRINQIIDLIENSDKLKAGVQSKAEKLADSIVPWNFAVTGITYLLTGSTIKAIAALTVDYSCAIKLATPISIISAMREASERQIVVKGGRYLEAFAEADTIIFDKTGTLTESSPKVAKCISLGKLSNDELLRQAACLEEHFPHSVATAIVEEADAKNLRHTEELHSEVEYIVAHGIATTLEGKRTVLGSKHFVIEDENVEITPETEEIIQENADKYSVIYFAIDGKLEGIICIYDPPREEAKPVLDELRKLGIQDIIMLTGDSENAAATTAEALGIDHYKSQVLPEDKASIVESIKAEGKNVIMVGDGINDSPALSAANVSVAMKDSSDLAREVADITLLRPNLNDLVTMRLISQQMIDLIHRNYRYILVLNTLFMGMGLTGVITPSLTSIFHNGSTMLIGLDSMTSKNFDQVQNYEALIEE
ncbi:heavy metal translocating P-type ATPase [Methanosphaera sp. WGK6]|uniref:heavy metal translocating P-type ATPase n=1 Tax=Methanosphaera sp. WGK6 TaxID=1561964 RepID=UPI00084C0D2A|nr:heavy metal translocating P-type ATPase [Methanosphaera sp. WGK6]OED29720.1 cation transporter [Methanosphaera sp. WGK6]